MTYMREPRTIKSSRPSEDLRVIRLRIVALAYLVSV